MIDPTPDMSHYSLRFATPQAWIATVLADFDQFIIDHAAAEKKASGMVTSMLSATLTAKIGACHE